MGSEDLVCASCSGLVIEGRCPTCRASREYLRRNSPNLSPQLFLTILVIIMVLTALAVRHAS
ncbi:hypothetical protein MXD61_11805 [Frankia sp. AgPm24]|uniref:Uncharacterized protein n=1 Tax=Frankia umida TaxID=573489 RepID=A0ABT0JSG3_9ACTN|nr:MULTISPECIES: hypothetical protein [Frankia]MCK9874498.1 hypothetical protein [Frankia umida]MCK9922554.1 hypothetical protein [Frankia sp. AgPm24]